MANTLRFKRGLASGLPTGLAGEPLFTTDTFDLYIGNGTGNTRFQKYIASGTTSQLLRGDGSLLSMPIVLTSPTNGQVLKFNGTSWVNATDTVGTGTVTSVGLTSATSGITITGSPVTTSGNLNFEIATASGTQNGLLSSTDWTTFNNKLSAAITSLGGLTASSQTFATGTSGTDFGIVSSGSTHTFNIPTASATNRGLLSSADWTTFNNKQNALTNPITGTGTSGQVAYFTGATTQAGSNNLFWDNTNARLGIGTNAPSGKLDVVGSLGAIRVLTSGAELYFTRDGNNDFYANAGTNAGLSIGGRNYVRFFTGSASLTEAARIFSSNNFAIGGTFASDFGQKLQVIGTGYFSDSVGIGSTSLTGFNLRIGKNIEGAVTSYGSAIVSTVQSGVTNSARIYYTEVGTAAASFTLPELHHYYAVQGTFGLGSAVTNQYGFHAHSTLTGATNNFGFYGNIAAATGRWNLYMNGTANNFMSGALILGNSALAGTTNAGLLLSRNITGSTISFGLQNLGTIQSDVTTQANYFITNARTAAASFTLTNLYHFRARQEAFGAGSVVTNQYGFFAEETLIDATNDYGFYGNIPSGTGRWNFYANGTALNYFNGNTLIGSTTDSGEKLQVTGTMKVTGASSFGGNMTLTLNQNAQTIFRITNTNNNASAISAFELYSDVGFGTFFKHPTARTYKFIAGNDLGIYNNSSAGDIAILNDFATGSIKFGAGGSSTAQMLLNASGNLGLAVTPSAWGSSWVAMQLGSATSISTFKSNTTLALVNNGYADSSNTWRYLTNNAVAMYVQSATSEHIWYRNASGTAGNSYTPSTIMMLDGSGNLLVGSATSSGERLQVTGTAKITGATSIGGAISAVGTFNLQRSGSGADTTIQFRNEVATNRAKIVFGGTNEELGFYAGGGTTENLRISNTGVATFSNKIITQSGSDAIEVGTPTGNNYRSNIYIKGTDGSAGLVNAYFGVNVFSTTGILDISNTNGISMRTGGSERLSIALTGEINTTNYINVNTTNGLTIGSFSGRRRIQYGSDAATAFSLLTDANGYAGLYAGSGVFSSNLTVDTNTLFVDATNNRVGIGTTTPSDTLHVVGNILAGNGGAFEIMNSSLTNVTCIRATGGGSNILSTASWGNNIAIGTETAHDLILASNNTERMRLKSDGFLQHTTGTNPSASVADSYLQYSADIVAGNAAPHFRTENGAVIKLYQETTGVGNSIFLQGGGNSVLDDSTFDGYTIRQIVKALRNQGILA